METITLKTLCERLNVSRRRIQGYEKAELMRPTDKNKYGHLLYDETAFHRAEWIKFVQQLGFTLKEIKDIIDAPETVVKEALEKQVKELKIEKNRLDQIIRRAEEYVKNLKGEAGE